MSMQAKEACGRALAVYATCLGDSHELCQEQRAHTRALR